MSLFRRGKRQSALEQLQGASWTCASCGEQHQGMFDLACFAPDFWIRPEAYEPNSALRLDGDFLSEDFCVIGGEDFFVRGVLEIPIEGMADKFGFGVWSTLSKQSFELYFEQFDEGSYSGLGPWTGWFSNRLATFPDTLNQPCWVYPQLDRQRPVFTLANDDHPLAIAQDTGISAERLMEVYAACGHSPA